MHKGPDPDGGQPFSNFPNLAMTVKTKVVFFEPGRHAAEKKKDKYVTLVITF